MYRYIFVTVLLFCFVIASFQQVVSIDSLDDENHAQKINDAKILAKAGFIYTGNQEANQNVKHAENLAGMLNEKQILIQYESQNAERNDDVLLGEANNSTLCTSCVVVFTILGDFIKSNQSMEFIIETISKVCPYLDPSIREVCPLMIRQMAPEVIQAFLERENPHEVCEMIHLCESSDKHSLPKNMDAVTIAKLKQTIVMAIKGRQSNHKH